MKKYPLTTLLCAGLLAVMPVLTSLSHLTGFLNSAYAASNTGDQVGVIDGKFSVNRNGAANYTVPIPVPPGRNHVEPKLSFAYNHLAGNGEMGMGWSLSGLSLIHRCPATLAQDGYTGGITYDSTDRFCLDGQRLVAVENKAGTKLTTLSSQASAYGKDGTVYYTENQGWTKVVSKGTCGSGPCSFDAWMADGTHLSFGSPDDQSDKANARVQAVGKDDVRIWALNKQVDTNGNYMSVSYFKDVTGSDATGEYYLNRIDYTGNQLSNPTLAPDRSVQFTYNLNGKNVPPTYQGGSLLHYKVLLTNVKTYVGSDLVSNFQLNYTLSKATGRNLLQSMQECSSDTASSSTCFLPTNFTWRDSEAGGWNTSSAYAPPTDIIDSNHANLGIQMVDLNGDGMTDLIQNLLKSDGTKTTGAWINTGNGWKADQSYIPPFYTAIEQYGGSNPYGFYVDLNSDGLTDMFQLKVDGTVNIESGAWLNTGSGWQSSSNYTPPTSTVATGGKASGVLLGDLNGDGRPDMMQNRSQTNGGIQAGAWLNNGNGWQSQGSYIPRIEIATDENGDMGVRLFDVNGDHLPDMVQGWSDGDSQTQQSVWINEDNSWTQDNSYNMPADTFFVIDGKDMGVQLIDFNGDGLQDILRWTKPPSNPKNPSAYTPGAWFSTGSGWTQADNYFSPTPLTNDGQDMGVRFIDVNDDGLQDMVAYQEGGVNNAWINSGGMWTLAQTMGYTYNSPIPFVNDAYQDMGVRMGDFTGDGIPDLLSAMEGQTSQSWVNPLVRSDLVDVMINGFGGEVDVTYAPLTDSSVYTVSSDDTPYPNVDVQGAMFVVKNYVTKDGSASYGRGTRGDTEGHVYTFDYQYEGARNNFQGRGWLGFEKVTIIDGDTKKRAVTSYMQDAPYTGQVSERDTLCDSGNPVDPKCTTDNTLLKKETMAYTCTDILTGKACVFGQGAEKNTKVYQVLAQTETEDVYDYGTFNYSQTTAYQSYDAYGHPTKIYDQTKQLYTCHQFSNDEDTWRIGFLTQSKITTNGSCDFSSWDSGQDWSWSKKTFDTSGASPRMNLLSESEWDDENNDWLTTSFAYQEGSNTYGNVSSITSPLGTTTIVYGSDHIFPHSETTPADAQGTSLTTTYTYDNRFGNKTSETDSNGHTTISCFDDFGRQTMTQGPLPDNPVTSTKDTNCLTGKKDVIMLSTTDYVNDSTGTYIETRQRISWDDSNTANWRWSRSYLDSLSRQYKTVSMGPSATQNVITEKEYDNQGFVEQGSTPYFCNGFDFSDCSSAERYYTSIDYDLYKRELKSTYPDGTITTNAYTGSASGQMTTITKAVGTSDERKEILHYDTLGNLALQEFFDDQGNALQTSHTYDKLQRQKTITDPSTPAAPGGVTESFTYNSLGLKTQLQETAVIGGKSQATGVGTISYEHNDQGLQSTQTNGKGEKTSLMYDALGRTTTKTFKNSSGTTTRTVQYTYDTSTYTDANPKGRLTKVVVYPGTTSTTPESQYDFLYDNYGNTKQVVLTMDGQTYTWKTAYHPDGQESQLTYPDQSVLERTYYPYGNLESLNLANFDSGSLSPSLNYATYENYNAQNAVGQITYPYDPSANCQGDDCALMATYTYTPQTGFLATQKIQDKGRGTTIADKSYSWNQHSDILGITDNNTLSRNGKSAFDYTQNLTYDSLGRLTKAVGIYGTKEYGYDASGNLVCKGATTAYSPSGSLLCTGGTTYTYQGHQLMTGSGANTVGITYDDSGSMYVKTLNGKKSAYTYQNDMLQQTQISSGVTASVSETYLYDYVGKRLKKDNQTTNATTWYVMPNYEITTDSNGTTHTKYIPGPSGTVATITTDNSTVNLLPPPATSSIAGLWQKTKDNLTDQWQEHIQSLLAQSLFIALYTLLLGGALWLMFLIIRGANTQSLLGKMRRGLIETLHRRQWLSHGTARKLARQHTTDIARRSPWMKWVSLVLIMATLTGCSNPAGLQSSILQLSKTETTSGTYPASAQFFQHDHIKSVQIITDNTGKVIAHEVYLPYGEIDTAHSTGIDLSPYKFSGEEWDSDTGLYYFGARYYDPVLGRFLSADSFNVGSANHPSSYNRYAYAVNNPVDYTDPSGHFAFLAAIAIGALIGAVVGGASYGIQTAASGNEFSWGDFGKSVAFGAITGAVGAGVGTAVSAGISAAFGAGASTFAGAVAGGAASGALAGGAEQVVTNALTGEKWDKDLGRAMVTGAIIGGITAGIGHAWSRYRGGNARATGCLSFPTGTPVLLSNMSKSVENVAVGDEVWGAHEITGEVDTYPVSDTFSRIADSLIVITIGTDIVKATPEHPFWEIDKGWTRAEDLRVGDKLLTRSGQTVAVTNLDKELGTFQVHNFEVDEAHTYYVSPSEVLVHNQPGPCTRTVRARYDEAVRREGLGESYEDLVEWGTRSRRPPLRYDGTGAPPIKPGTGMGPTAYQPFPDAVKAQAFAENPRQICVFCRREGVATQVDHAWSRATGGNATFDNAQLACPHCNASKGAGLRPGTAPAGYYGTWPPPWF